MCGKNSKLDSVFNVYCNSYRSSRIYYLWLFYEFSFIHIKRSSNSQAFQYITQTWNNHNYISNLVSLENSKLFIQGGIFLNKLSWNGAVWAQIVRGKPKTNKKQSQMFCAVSIYKFSSIIIWPNEILTFSLNNAHLATERVHL